MGEDRTRLTLRAGGPQMTSAQSVLVSCLERELEPVGDVLVFEHARNEAFRTLDDAYDPAGLPELHVRVPGHVREVHDDH